MNAPDRFPIISEEYAASIGHVAVNWSMVEDAVRYAIMTLLGQTEAAGVALTAEMPNLSCMNLLTTLIALFEETEWSGHWNQIKSEIDILRTMRNDIIHAEWGVSGGVHSALRHKAKGKVFRVFSPSYSAAWQGFGSGCRVSW